MAEWVPGGVAGRAGGEGRGVFDPAASAGLFVGVSSFEDERIPSVPFAADDAVDLAHLFVLELGLVAPERTVLLLAGEPRKPESVERLAQLVERGARCQTARQREVYRHLGELARGTEAPGLMVVTVATHGVSDQGGDFLVATDSLKERTLRTGVAVAEMFDEVARAGAGRRLVLLDACRERLSHGTRGVDEAAMAQSFADAIARAEGSVVLAGAPLGGFAYDDGARKNGVFTAAVLDGLRGGAPAGPDGWITVRTLADFVQQRVAAWVRRHRPDHAHAARSLGIERRIEATAEALPLAPHPDATRVRQSYGTRRAAALGRVRENLGRVLRREHWDQIDARLPAEGSSPEVERLLEEIEALDGSERAQRSLRDFLRELSEGVDSASPSRDEETRPAEAAKPATRRAEARQGVVGSDLARSAELPAGTLDIGPLGMHLRYVPRGTYTIGSPDDEPGRFNDETRHEVRITHGFWLAETELTQAQWCQLVPENPSRFRADSGGCPVENVNWYEAVAFANLLSDREGLPRCYELVGCTGTLGRGDFTCRSVTFTGLDCPGYRLPTEAEWEVAARAGTATAIYTGGLALRRDDAAPELDPIAWYGGNSGGRPHPIGQKQTNAWGFCDLLGNVFEWTGDWYGDYPTGSVVDPLGPPEGSGRVIRGGSWSEIAQRVRSAYRDLYDPADRWGDLGFRLARGPDLRSRGRSPAP